MRNNRSLEKFSPVRKHPFLPGSWQRETYSIYALGLLRDIRKEKEENER